jgi:PST family polysaccharide transporter
LSCPARVPECSVKLFLTLAIIASGLAGRSAIDKALAVRGGAELVALWAQLASVVELVSGVAIAGVATGLAVYVARTARAERQRDLLREALRLGLALSLPVALLAALGGLLAPKLSPVLIAVAAFAGWIAVIPGVLNSYWLGQQRRERMLALALGSAAIALLVAIAAPEAHLLWLLALSQAAPALVLLFLEKSASVPRFRSRSHPLRRYLLPGLAIGVLSPASLLAARAIVGESLSWHEAGVLQALWRVADWVCGFAAGILSVYFLPRFAALRGSPDFSSELRRAALWTLAPGAAVFLILYLAQRPLVAFLYEADFAASDGAVALLFAGSVARIASWIPLFALYAMRRTRAIALGELFSLPLFVLLLGGIGKALTLESAGAAWLASYAVYLVFNLWAMRRG